MRRAIAKSCNTYFYAMGHRIGYDNIAPMAKLLGLGAKFDLPVVSQSYGTVPDSEWKLRKFKEKRRMVERPDWTASDTLNASIGQGFLIVNPLQLASMAARIASGRNLQPQLLGAHKRARPAARHSRRTSRRGPRRHVGGGQRRRHRRARASCRSTDIEMSGKTGTAQVRRIAGGASRGQGGDWRYRDHGLFVFFAPSDKPRYAGAVVIEHGLGGARAAAPVAKDVLTFLFDRPKAMESLDALEQQWGGTLAERTARRAAAIKASQREPDRMISSAIIPQPLAKLPWRLIFLVIGIGMMGIMTLYSAAGGAMQPWALKQAMVFAVFATLALACRGSRNRPSRRLTFPVYAVDPGHAGHR